jgi:hypothetical protein
MRNKYVSPPWKNIKMTIKMTTEATYNSCVSTLEPIMTNKSVSPPWKNIKMTIKMITEATYNSCVSTLE